MLRYFLDYLQDNIAGRSVIDAHFRRHHHHVILSDVETRRTQAISAKQKFKKVFCITTFESLTIRLNYCCSFVRLPSCWHSYYHYTLRLSVTFSFIVLVSLPLAKQPSTWQ